MADRRFRDMRLTEDEVETEVYMHTGLVTDNAFYPGMRTSRFRSFDDGQDNSRYLRFMARAKRLLPLWREWGLRNLYRDSYVLNAEAQERIGNGIKSTETKRSGRRQGSASEEGAQEGDQASAQAEAEEQVTQFETT